MDIQGVVDWLSPVVLGEKSGDSIHIEESASFAEKLIQTLIELSWEPINALSHCSKANQEALLSRKGLRLHIVSANFLGQFIQIEVFQSG